jgi:hypothetical protein
MGMAPLALLAILALFALATIAAGLVRAFSGDASRGDGG